MLRAGQVTRPHPQSLSPEEREESAAPCPRRGWFSVPLESSGVGSRVLVMQVVGFSRGAKADGENWLNSHIFPPFLASSMGSFLSESGRRGGFVRFGGI